jgi:hypothetical protein
MIRSAAITEKVSAFWALFHIKNAQYKEPGPACDEPAVFKPYLLYCVKGSRRLQQYIGKLRKVKWTLCIMLQILSWTGQSAATIKESRVQACILAPEEYTFQSASVFHGISDIAAKMKMCTFGLNTHFS